VPGVHPGPAPVLPSLDRGGRQSREHRCFVGPIVRRLVGVARQSSTMHPTRDERLDGCQDFLDIEGRQFVHRMKPQRPAAHGREHAIEDERMEVQVEVERAPEALDHDDASGGPSRMPASHARSRSRRNTARASTPATARQRSWSQARRVGLPGFEKPRE
jgi:hypothetical protein